MGLYTVSVPGLTAGAIVQVGGIDVVSGVGGGYVTSVSSGSFGVAVTSGGPASDNTDPTFVVLKL